MAVNFRALAKKNTELAEIMSGREKGETAELINLGNVTINNFEKVILVKDSDNGIVDEFWAFTVKEIPNKFFFGGFVVNKLFETFVAEYHGDYEECIKDFSELVVKFRSGKTRAGKQITTIEII